MQYALIIIGFPEEPSDGAARKRQHDCLSIAEGIAATNTKTERLAAGVWSIPLESDLPVFAALVKCAAEWQVPAHTLILDGKPPLLKS